MESNCGAILLAGGKGARFHGQKQFMELLGKPLWKHVYDKLASIVDSTRIVVVGVDVPGGETRTGSVINGMQALEGAERVVIAEAARPMVTVEQLRLLAKDEHPSAAFVTPLVNTVVMRNGGYLNREEMYQLLTPQAFSYPLLREALASGRFHDVTDETRVMYEYHGIKPHFIETGDNLMKVTYPNDLYLVKTIMEREGQNMEKKKVLITGGQGDLAQAIARQLIEIGGYTVETPGRSELDVTDAQSVERYLDKFTPDILVNNAGFVYPQSIKDCDLKKEKKAIDINLWGVFNCTGAVLRRNKQARIVNIGSSAATKVHGTWSSYCATKAAVVMATRCWAEDGVDTVCISPGRAATKMRRGLYPDEDQSTLMRPEDFAVIIGYAVRGLYKPGEHINVNLQNVKELIKEKESQ